MRPRHYAAENILHVAPELIVIGVASMRPRHYAAENSDRRGRPLPGCRSFNEAAALRRGKHVAGRDMHVLVPLASMRPRHYAAENECLTR